MDLATEYDATPAPKVLDLNDAAKQGDIETESLQVDDVSPFSLKGFKVRPSSEIPKRRWLYGSAYLGGIVAGTIAPGGAGKSALTLAEAIAIASMPCTGDETHSFLGQWTRRGLRVAYLNLEDDAIEQERRAAAVIELHGLDRAALIDRLFIADKTAFGLTLADMDSGRAVICEDVARLEATIRQGKIDVVIIDPFVSAHNVPENDNGAIDKTIKALGAVAHRTGACIHLVHHVAKLRGDALSQDSARGASAFVDGLRALRGVVKMSQAEADSAGLKSPNGYIRAENMKVNYVKSESGDWYHLNSHTLGNGESVGVPVSWQYPDALDSFDRDQARRAIKAIQEAQPVRQSPQSHGVWVGSIIGDVMGWDVPDGAVKKDARTQEQAEALAKVTRAVRAWENSGMLLACKIPHPERNDRKITAYTVNADKVTPATT